MTTLSPAAIEAKWNRIATNQIAVSCGPVMLDGAAVLDGHTLHIYLHEPGASSGPWAGPARGPLGLKGLGVPVHDAGPRDVRRVVEAVRSLPVRWPFPPRVMLWSGWETGYDLENLMPYVHGLRTGTGAWVAAQFHPQPHPWKYPWVAGLGLSLLVLPISVSELAAREPSDRARWFREALESMESHAGPGSVAVELGVDAGGEALAGVLLTLAARGVAWFLTPAGTVSWDELRGALEFVASRLVVVGGRGVDVQSSVALTPSDVQSWAAERMTPARWMGLDLAKLQRWRSRFPGHAPDGNDPYDASPFSPQAAAAT